VCTACAPGDQEKSCDSQREQTLCEVRVSVAAGHRDQGPRAGEGAYVLVDNRRGGPTNTEWLLRYRLGCARPPSRGMALFANLRFQRFRALDRSPSRGSGVKHTISEAAFVRGKADHGLYRLRNEIPSHVFWMIEVSESSRRHVPCEFDCGRRSRSRSRITLSSGWANFMRF
jgi:hypothetical protein